MPLFAIDTVFAGSDEHQGEKQNAEFPPLGGAVERGGVALFPVPRVNADAQESGIFVVR